MGIFIAQRLRSVRLCVCLGETAILSTAHPLPVERLEVLWTFWKTALCECCAGSLERKERRCVVSACLRACMRVRACVCVWDSPDSTRGSFLLCFFSNIMPPNQWRLRRAQDGFKSRSLHPIRLRQEVDKNKCINQRKVWTFCKVMTNF